MKILIYIFHTYLCQSLDLENLLGVGENLPFMKDLLTVLDLEYRVPFRNARKYFKNFNYKNVFKPTNIKF